jgi:O-succinylbenzoate synthase
LRIDELTLHHVAMPLKEPYRTGFGDETVIESILVRLTSGGVSVWSESTPFGEPLYSPDWAAGAYQVIQRWLAPLLVGREIDTATELTSLLAVLRGHRFAKAALDIAWWTLDAALAGVPVHAHLAGGTPTRDRFEVGQALGTAETVDTLLRQVGEAVDEGYRRVKLKIRHGWDVDVVRAVRQQHPDLVLHVDANASYTLDDADVFRQLDVFGLAMFEQPLAYDDLRDHARLQTLVDTPICLDESLVSVRHLEWALELGSCRAINIKPGRVGGFTESVALQELAREQGVTCWVGGMLESAIGGAICAALQTLPGFDYPGDVFPSSRFYLQDLATSELEFDRGPDREPRAIAPSSPGLPQTPDPGRLAACTVQSTSFAA